MKLFKKVTAVASGLFLSASAFAADPATVDLTTLTSKFDPTPIIVAIMAIAAVLMLIGVAKRGAAIVVGMVGGNRN